MTIDRRNLLLLGLAWLAAILLIGHGGDYPTTDDWAYIVSVRALVEQGRLVYHDWAAANLISHFFWGALFGSLFGTSYVTLRVSTLVAALLGGIALYRLLRLLPIEPPMALLAAAVWLFNPLCLALSFGFMSDIGFTALMLCALVLLAGAELRRHRAYGIAGWLLGVAALLSRQLGIVIPIGWAAGRLSTRPGWNWRLARLLAPVFCFLLVQLVFQRWLMTSGHAPALYGRQTDGIASRLLHSPWGTIRLAIGMAPKVFLYCGILGFPVALAIMPGWLGRHSRKWRWGIAGGGVLAAALVIGGMAWRHMLFPIWPNTLSYFGIGPDLHGPLTPAPVLWSLTILAVTGGLMVTILTAAAVAAMIRTPPDRGRRFDIAAATFATGAVLVGLVMIVEMRFDRYMIPILACALIVTVAAQRGRAIGQRAIVAGSIAAAVMATISVASVHDTVAAKRLQADAFARIAARAGVRNVDGGWVLNGPTYFRCFATTPDSAPDAWLHAAFVVEPADAPRPGYRILERIAVPRWLPWGRATMPILVERDVAGRTFSTDPLIDPAACRP